MPKIKLSTGKTVEMREPKVRDMRIVGDKKSDEDKEIHLIANLTALSVDEIDELSLKDYALLTKELQTFL